MSAKDAMDPLAYVMNTMNENEVNFTHGIALISNFEGWTMEHFSVEYFTLLISMLQGGAIPTNVTSWIIVNAPPFFHRFFSKMKRIMSPAFQKRVHIIEECKLSKYLQPGYQAFLPREMATGRAITHEMVVDFIDLRKHVESQKSSGGRTALQKRTSMALTEATFSSSSGSWSVEDFDHSSTECW